MSRWKNKILPGICDVVECKNKKMGNGTVNGIKYYKRFCSRHHCLKFGLPYGGHRHRTQLKGGIYEMSKLPCSRCGWKKSFSDRHRLIPGKMGGKYVPENVIPLCPNCHRVEHNSNLQ